MIEAPELPANAGGNDPAKNANPKTAGSSSEDPKDASESAFRSERRRPGRHEYVSDELVELLREPGLMREELDVVLRENDEHISNNSFLKLTIAMICMWGLLTLLWLEAARFF